MSNLYKYCINKEHKICVVECPILEEGIFSRKGKFYHIKMGKTTNYVYEDEIDKLNNKIMYSFDQDKLEDYIDMIKEHFNRVSNDYLNKSKQAMDNLGVILKTNGIKEDISI